MTIQEYIEQLRAKRQKKEEPKKRQVNTVPAANIFGSFGFENPLRGRYSDAYMWMLFKIIFGGLKNVAFHTDESIRTDTKAGRATRKKVADIIDFIDTNASLLIWYWWTYGYIVADYDQNGRLYVPKMADVRKDSNGNVIGFPLVYYSDPYLFSRRSDFDIISESVNNIDRLRNGDAYITQTLSVFGILSGSDELPILESDKEDFLQVWKDSVGITRDKHQFAILRNPVNFQQIDFHIESLKFGEKVKDEVQFLAGYFGIPYDLVPLSGKSTYDNQRQALRNFYSQCISPLAEVLLKFARHIIKCDREIMMRSANLTFSIDNVPELEDDRTATIEYKAKVIAAMKELNAMGLEVPDDMKKEIYEDEKH